MMFGEDDRRKSGRGMFTGKVDAQLEMDAGEVKRVCHSCFEELIEYMKEDESPTKRKEDESSIKKKVTDDELIKALDYARVCIKYNMFDLLATRRENAYLKELLEKYGEI